MLARFTGLQKLKLQLKWPSKIYQIEWKRINIYDDKENSILIINLNYEIYRYNSFLMNKPDFI